MRERICLAPGANGVELLKSLAMKGVNCLNLRVVGAGELARMGLMRSGIAISEDFVSSGEEVALIAQAVKCVSYFDKATYSDIQQISGAIRRMRCLVSSGDEAEQIELAMNQGIFMNKNSALIQVYKNYMNILKRDKLIDLVSLMRRAASESCAIDADFFILEEYPLKPLERALLDKLSGGKYEVKTLPDLFGVSGASVKAESFKNCYGAPNEVETILTDIYTGKNLDTCTVAVTDPATYGQLFFDYALLYDMPITFGCGIPIINSNPARLLVLYYKWMTGGFFGSYALNEMLSSGAFDRKVLREIYPVPDEDFSWSLYSDVLGSLRLTNDAEINKTRLKEFADSVSEEEALADPEDEKAVKKVRRKKLCIPFLEVIAAELALPAEEFILKYSYIRKGNATNSQRLLMMLDMAANRAIYDELRIMRASGVEQATDDMILNVLKRGVSEVSSEAGGLFVTGIDGALSACRENLYIAGLSASAYPGSPRENYLMLDADIKLFGDEADFMTSDGNIKRKSRNLLSLVRLASGLGSKVNVSYAGLNVSELKRDNASSLVYEIIREECGKNVTSKDVEDRVEKVEYFTPAISVTRKVGEAYVAGETVLGSCVDEASEKFKVNLDLERAYSPSALEDFFNCPRAFMLGRVLGIPEPDDDKPFEVIAANETGTMAHLLLEELANSDISREDFLKMAGEYFDRFLKQHPPLVKQNAEAEKEMFIDMMDTAYDMDPHREVILKEEDVQFKHESGVNLHGFPDRVEKDESGNYVIVDFKSGRNVKHVENDIDTCLQIVIYAYLMEQKGYHVSGGEYRYIRLGETVKCDYNREMKDKLNAKLEEFRKAMEKSEFPVSPYAILRHDDDPDPCKYCKFGNVCGREADGLAFPEAAMAAVNESEGGAGNE
ncbi:MAG: PD-(D/E)XK nuclease family protein [Lachnospiraceae bacterium]|nr:PD-(D/E)XK nuclease family protein [Lachnospiraceae bacterium]